MADEQALTIVKSEPLPELKIIKSEPETHVPIGAATTGIIARSVPAIASGAEEFATNPNVARTAAKIGRVVGGLTPPIAGAVEGGPIGALAGVAAASKGAWAGGKTGWFTGKMLQDLSAPVANAMKTLAPYAQTISTLSGTQGVLDLAQMADATRKDIGTLGVSLSDPPRTQAERDAHPALINAVVSKIGDLASELKNNGIPAAEATALKLISDGNAATFGKLMTLYMGSRSVRP